MAATPNPAPVMVQTNTYNMNPNENHQCICLPRFCCIMLPIASCMTIMSGASSIALGASIGSSQTSLYIGIGLLMIGVILMIICIMLCRHIKRSNSSPAMYSGTAMTTTIVAPPNASSSGVVQPPHIPGTGGQSTYMHSYQPAHPGSSQHVQPASNQYRPVQTAINQYPPAQHMAQPSAPRDMLPDQPPPTYKELMQPADYSTKSYGNV